MENGVTMIDVSKIKSGDRITVELIVSRSPARDGVLYAGTVDEPLRNSILTSTIIGHTPKPREIKMGDVGFCLNNSFGKGRQLLVTAVGEQRLIVKAERSSFGQILPNEWSGEVSLLKEHFKLA